MREDSKEITNHSVEFEDINCAALDVEVFKEKLSKAQRVYNIRIAEGYNPNKRSPKRITILVSEAYLTSGGSIHWVQDLEAEVYKLCKEYYLDCDELEMESVDRSYICRDEKSKLYGRKIAATKFDNHLINKTNISKEDIPLARAVIHFLKNIFKKEDEKDGNTYYPGKGVVRTSGNKQSKSLSIKKRERITLCKPNSNRKSLSSQKIHTVGKSKLPE